MTTNLAGCWPNHALATEINRTCNVPSAFSPLEEQRLYSMKVLLQSQPPTSSSSSFGRQNVVKRNFNFILVTAQTHGFQKTVMFKTESLHPSFALPISIFLHILQPPRCCLSYIRPQSWKVDPAWWLMLAKQPCHSAQSLWEGEAATTPPTHGPSADPPQTSRRGDDATFPSPGLNIPEMPGSASHREGERVVCKEILPPPHPGYHHRGVRPPHPAQPWAQQLPSHHRCSPVRTTLQGNAAWYPRCLQVMM